MMTLIVILLALGAIGLFYTAARSRKKRATQHIRPIDMKAFRAITDRSDEDPTNAPFIHSAIAFFQS